MGFISPTEDQVLEAYQVLCKKNNRGTSVTEAARYLVPHQASRNYTPGNTIYNSVYGKTRLLAKKGLLVRIGERVGHKGAVLYAPANVLPRQAAPEPPPPPPQPRGSYVQIKDMSLWEAIHGMGVTRESDLRDQANKDFSDEELDQACAAIEILEWKNPNGGGILDIIGLVYPDLVNPAWDTHPYEYKRIKSVLARLRREGRINMEMVVGMKRKCALYTLAKTLPTAEPHPLKPTQEHMELMDTNQPEAEPKDLSVVALQANLGKAIEAFETMQEILTPTLAMLLDMEKELARYAKVMITLGTLRSQLGVHDG